MIIFQFVLSVIGGVLFMLGWNAVTTPMGPHDHSGQVLPYVAAFAGYWFNKAIMFCIIWVRFGLAAARSMRLLDKRPDGRLR